MGGSENSFLWITRSVFFSSSVEPNTRVITDTTPTATTRTGAGIFRGRCHWICTTVRSWKSRHVVKYVSGLVQSFAYTTFSSLSTRVIRYSRAW